MKFINELKEFDSLYNCWITIAERETEHAFETSMHGDDEDLTGFEHVLWRKSRKGKGDEMYFIPDTKMI